jgi:RNA polymerase sigma-70 factor (ECF subfamily)
MDADIQARNAAGSVTDDDLVRAAKDGDTVALETLLVRYQPRLYRFGLRMCGNVEDAGEIAQQSLIAMARSLGDFRGDSSMSTWLYTIARRFCLKKRRRSRFAPEQEESLDTPGTDAVYRLADPAPSPEQAAANQELASALSRAIGALDRAHREVLILRDVEGLPAAQVAAIIGVSVDAVKSRLHRARVAVRQELAPLLGDPARKPSRGAACPDVLTLFSQHLEGDIDRSVCERMEAHLAQCRRCSDACESLKRMLALCRQLPAPDVPASIAASVHAAIQAFVSHEQGISRQAAKPQR